MSNVSNDTLVSECGDDMLTLPVSYVGLSIKSNSSKTICVAICMSTDMSIDNVYQVY